MRPTPPCSSPSIRPWTRAARSWTLALTVAAAGLLAQTCVQPQDRSSPFRAADTPADRAMTETVWTLLQQSRWLADGTDKAPRTVYVFTDPNCPYCNKFWADARPWVDAGKVQLRHVIVGILTPTSPGKAAALLTSENPAATLAAYERGQVAATAKALASGRPRPLGDEGIQPLATIPTAIQAQLDANEQIMAALALRATPAVVWRDARSALQMRTGVPEQSVAEIMGPR